MKVFITGDEGYIGSRLRVHLKECFGDKISIEGYDIKNGKDINNRLTLTTRMKRFSPNIVIHLAAISNVSESEKDIRKTYRTNVIGTKNVVEAMEKAKCHNIIYASTCAVYKPRNDKLPFSEKDDCAPISMYGITKLAGEHVLFGSKLNSIVFRMFNVVSPKFDSESPETFNDRLFSAIKTGDLTIYGNKYRTKDGTAERDYISLNEVCRAYVCALRFFETNMLENPSVVKKVYNVCSGISTSVLEIVESYGINNYKIGKKRKGDPEKVFGSNELIKEIFWETEYDVIKDILV